MRFLAVAGACALALAPAACRPARGEREGGVVLSACHLAHPSAPARVEARCGTVDVPEDWSRPAGRRISLRVAVLRAEHPHAEEDAVFFLAGGPGQAATEQYPAVAPALARLRKDRDLVLVDQRGTGGSSPLACPAPPGGDAAALRRSADEEVRLLAACAKGLAADVAQYTTAAFVQDLEHVRERLGYPRVDLVGVSYGTRAALEYLRRFPSRVRALVLDGVAPPELPVGAFFAADAQRALDLAFRRCAADPSCAAAYPGLPERFAALSAALGRRPAHVRVAHPTTGAARALDFGRAELARAVFLLSYAPETTALLPVLVDRAARQEDPSALAAQALLVADQLEGDIARPLQYSVLCAEDVPFYPPAAATASAGYLGDELTRSFRAVCEAWPHARPARDEVKSPVRADVPALLLSGEADPVTPPAWGEVAARSLPRARHLVLPGGGHGSLFRGCIPRLVERFIDGGSAEGLDASCVERMRPAPFFVDLVGPAP
ncbi:MAG: alpha/beta hydrolase [Anaeromyxobacteraceae bacterium]